MKFLFFVFSLAMVSTAFGQSTTCAGAVAGSNFASGSCKTAQAASTAVTAANCGGGFNSGVGLYYKFVAGTCPQFDITFNAAEEVQYILWTSACVNLSVECSEATANVPVSESFSAGTGTGGANAGQMGPGLTNGTTYVIEIVTKTNSNFDICYTASEAENADNECAGASGVSSTGSTFNNGGNCDYTGSLTDGTTSDPAAASFCAGSLENTLWTKFSPTAGSTSIQIIGSGISCSGPVCAWQFGLFSGACGALIPEGCISDGTSCASGPDPNTSSTAPAGTTNAYLLTWNSISATAFTGTITRNGGVAFTGSEVFYLAMDGNANSDCQFTLSGVNLQPLPIDLIYFNVKKYDNANMINWEVASQRDNDFFTIQRSQDAEIWEDIKYIDGDGTSSTQKKYAYTDSDISSKLNYYRLKQTDFNGEYQYSNIAVANNSNEGKAIDKIFNSLGQIVDENYTGLKIYLYKDGTIEKKL